MRTYIDISGQTFGRLVVIKPTEKMSGTHRLWLCKCTCPEKNQILAVATNLKQGRVQSCGCYAKEKLIERNTRHGATVRNEHFPLYGIYAAMKQRCYNKNDPRYSDYGGRGILVYKEWHKYEPFRDYMLALDNCPKDAEIPGAFLDRQIDRIRNNEDYRPGNVRWATRKVQANNKRNNKIIRINGVTYTFADAVERFGRAPYGTIYHRVYISKWPLKQAFLTPPVSDRKRPT